MSIRITYKLNIKETKSALNKIIAELGERIGETMVLDQKDQTPIDTGNLRQSHIFEQKINSDANVVSAGPDIDRADYAKHVYYPGVTRNYAGNKWIDRALNNSKGKIISLVKQVERFING